MVTMLFNECLVLHLNFLTPGRPCILIFDSLTTGSHARVAATLREYLTCEYKAKMEGEAW